MAETEFGQSLGVGGSQRLLIFSCISGVLFFQCFSKNCVSLSAFVELASVCICKVHYMSQEFKVPVSCVTNMEIEAL